MPQDNHKELSHDDMQKVMSTVDIPACPTFVTEAMTEAQKDEPDLAKLAAIIANDAGMSATALRLANSPLYRGANPVTGLRQAVDRLGTKNIVCVVVATALKSAMGGLPPAWLDAFWRRTSILAMAASMIARRQFGISADAAYTYTLFHDAAIPLMMKRFDNYEDLLEQCRVAGRLIVEAEDELYPCTHPIVGSLLVRNWGLPSLLGQAIRFHHEKDAYDLPDRTLPGGALSLIAVTQVAERLVAEANSEPDLEVGDDLFVHAQDYLGISDNEMDELRTRIAQAIDEFAG